MEKAHFNEVVNKLIHLFAIYLNNKEADFNIDEALLNDFLRLCSHHSLKAFLYAAIKKSHAKAPQEQLKSLEEYYYLMVRRVALFDRERKGLFDFLNQNNIDYLPLKGLILKDYYPDPYTREFADNDIYFSTGDDLIKKYFKSQGYSIKVYRKSNHDVYMKKPFFNFEMHRALFELREDNKKIVNYFKNYFEKTLEKNEHERYLSDEDFYIYFTAHSYKHYHHSGCGIRTLIDYYIYLMNTHLDFDYIDQELVKLDLLDFSNDMRHLSVKLFNEEPLTEREQDILIYIASSGTYGTLANSVERGVESKGKFRYYMSRVFPPLGFYKKYYPWAYYTIILLPIAWLIRFFRILFRNPRRARTELKVIRQYKKNKK